MSQRLYVFFQPFGCDYNDIHQQARMIDEAVPDAVERKSRGSIDIQGLGLDVWNVTPCSHICVSVFGHIGVTFLTGRGFGNM